jgi:hypothetical protein
MAQKESLGAQVPGAAIELASKVKAALEADPGCTLVTTSYGSFYVSRIELTYGSHGDHEVVGYLVPDEGEGDSLDFWTPAEAKP